ncbi:helix-turn-helix domain-containing protein [Leucobacter allii]|uniref:Helix-turn-helix domain-containing protein n=1 Tax=Leucobacter allii TaxID=2932247 RepID=A0ABY4FJ80_9MICO|nr:helix-turn-helix domain-containing protein [Leucobacter allii]UOQ56740.1 helix-turn-helix domain-containing protein [Leucobacter allii]
MSDTGWAQLLDRVRAQIPELLAEFLDELRTHGGYADGEVPQADIERTALQAFDLFLDRLADPEGAASSAFPEALGRRRARQGMRVEQFAEGVRINFRLLWRALHRAAQPDLVDALVAGGERVLTVVEGYATEVQAAFLDETQTMARFHRTARERALARIFSGAAAEEELRAAAETLALPFEQRYELVSLASDGVAEELRRSLAEQALWVYEDDDLVHAFRARRGSVDWSLAVRDVAGARVARVHGVAALAPAAALTRRISALGRANRILSAREAFPALLQERALTLFAGFEEELLGDWRRAPAEERLRLAETLRAFMRRGSVKEAGEELFLHRNTVFKRLRAFQDLTGLDVTVPADAAIAAVMLAEIAEV